MSNYQLFRKIRLAFEHVLIPLKSEFNFDKLLIVNDLTKCNSLQTSFSGDQGNNIFAEGMRERMDWWDWWANRILPAYFTPHSQPSSFGMINNQRFTKAQASFGYLRKYPSADAIFINYLLSVFYKNNGWLWGRNGRFRPELSADPETAPKT